MAITSLRGWLALVAVGGLVVAVLVWSVVGEIPTKVKGQGILIRPSGVMRVVATGDGQVETIRIRSGDRVKKGEVVATLIQPVLDEQIASTKRRISYLAEEIDKIQKTFSSEESSEKEFLVRQRAALEARIRTSKNKQSYYKTRLAKDEELLKQGLVTEETVYQSRLELSRAEDEILSYRSQMEQLEFRREEELSDEEETLTNLLQQRYSLEAELREYEARLNRSRQIISSHKGEVMDVSVVAGNEVRTGDTLLRIEEDGNSDELLLVFYLPPQQGKRVKPEMRADISPSTARKEKWGVMIGDVTNVSDFPTTMASMESILDDPLLAREFAGKTAPLQAFAALRSDPKDPSGYQWTSSPGPDLRVTAGTICQVEIVVKRQKPITLAIPAIRKWLGLDD